MLRLFTHKHKYEACKQAGKQTSLFFKHNSILPLEEYEKFTSLIEAVLRLGVWGREGRDRWVVAGKSCGWVLCDMTRLWMLYAYEVCRKSRQPLLPHLSGRRMRTGIIEHQISPSFPLLCFAPHPIILSD